MTTGRRRGPRTGPGGQAGEEKGAKENRKEQPVRGGDLPDGNARTGASRDV